MIPETAIKQIEYIKKRCEEIKPFVAIRCITYNHEKYLREALESFVMQQTDFPYIAIVHEDASTDSTAEILKEYAEKYPDIIFPIYEEENQYSKKNGVIRAIMKEAVEVSGAKYVAFCEGDDYWIDPLKLQRQINYLETHPDYSITFHNARIKNESDKKFGYKPLQEKEYTSDEVYRQWIVPTASIVMKKDALDFTLDSRLMNGDIWYILSGLDHGKGFALQDYMSVYRVTNNGIQLRRIRELGIIFFEKMIYHNELIKERFSKISNKIWNKKQSFAYLYCAINSTNFKKFKYYYESMKLSPSTIPIYYIKTSIKKTLNFLLPNKILPERLKK